MAASHGIARLARGGTKRMSSAIQQPTALEWLPSTAPLDHGTGLYSRRAGACREGRGPIGTRDPADERATDRAHAAGIIKQGPAQALIPSCGTLFLYGWTSTLRGLCWRHRGFPWVIWEVTQSQDCKEVLEYGVVPTSPAVGRCPSTAHEQAKVAPC